MRSVVAVGCAVVWVLTAGLARASEQSERLYSRGLVEFHADHLQKALELFDQAVAADPNDIYAHYYRAVTRSRLKDTEGAIADLRVVLAAKPDLQEAQLDLGIALVQTAQYREAIPWLEKAQGTPDFDGQASLFLGIAQLRLGELTSAQASFERAAARDPQQSVAARYYLGVTAYQQGRLSASREHFTFVSQLSPETDMGRESKIFLDRIDTVQQRWQYSLYASLGMQYDSNVPLLNDITSNLAGVDNKQSDGAVTIGLGGAYIPWQNDTITLSLGYDFFQSLHFDLVGFNLQDHGPSVQVAFNTDPVQFGVLGRYDYYILENNSFLQEATALPWLTVPEDDFGRSEFYTRIRRSDFKNMAYYVLDNFDYAVGIRQVAYLGSPDRYFSVGYQWDRNDPVIDNNILPPPDPQNPSLSPADEPLGPNSYGYDGNEVNTGAGWLLPLSITGNASFAYRHERYKFVASEGRRDDEYLVTVAFSRPIINHLDLIVAYLGDYNNSWRANAPTDQKLFQYDRSIVSVAVEARF